MTETERSEYLDRLVLTYLHQNNQLTILETAPEQERPKIFLENIGWVQQKDYIEDALKVYLSTSSPPLPQGYVYVFTPNDGFKYSNNRGRITHTGMSNGSAASAFSEALDEIVDQAEANAKIGTGTVSNILFFNESSLRKFENELREKLEKKARNLSKKTQSQIGFSYSAKPGDLNVDNYGKVRLYEYAIRQVLPPNK